MSLRHAALLTLISFLVATILYSPAAQWHARFAADSGALKLYGVEGTLAQGGVSGGVVNDGRRVLDRLQWTLQPWRLLLLQLGLDLKGGISESGFSVRLQWAPGAGLHLRDLEAALDVKTLAQLAGQSYVPIEGRTQIRLDTLDWNDAQPAAAGRIEVRDLRWTLARAPLVLGDFDVQIEPFDDGVKLILSSVSGPLELRGETRWLAERRYDTDIQMRPKPDADAALQSLVRSIGPADAQGWHRFNRRGQWAS